MGFHRQSCCSSESTSGEHCKDKHNFVLHAESITRKSFSSIKMFVLLSGWCWCVDLNCIYWRSKLSYDGTLLRYSAFSPFSYSQSVHEGYSWGLSFRKSILHPLHKYSQSLINCKNQLVWEINTEKLFLHGMGQSGDQIQCSFKSSFIEDTLEVWTTLISANTS